MDLNEFSDKYVSRLLDNIEESKTTLLLRDLLKYESQQMNFGILSPPI